MHLLDSGCIKLKRSLRPGSGLVGNKNAGNHTYTSFGDITVPREGAVSFSVKLTSLYAPSRQTAAVNCTLVLWTGLSDIEARPFIHLKHLPSLRGDRSRTTAAG